MKNPLEGKTLEHILTKLVEHFGFEKLSQDININCFRSDPTIKSSLKFLRKAPWARTKVENLYLKTYIEKPSKREDRWKAIEQMNLKILLVDDTLDNRFIVKSYLKAYPFKIVEADDGDLAVVAFKNEEFDLVFMDIRMKKLNGFEATKQIRLWEKEFNKVPTPIIALTASAMDKDKKEAFESGCNEHLAKPIRKQEILSMISRFVTQEETKSNSDEIEQDDDENSLNEISQDILDLIPSYLANKQKSVLEIETAFKKSNFEDIEEIAHKISGSAGSYGLSRLGDLFTKLEVAAQDKHNERVLELITDIHQHLDEQESLLKQ